MKNNPNGQEIVIAFTIHVIHGEWHFPLLMYAAVALFVMAHGPVKIEPGRT